MSILANILRSEKEDFKVVEVMFPTASGWSHKTYHYKTMEDIRIGDWVVVVAPDFNNDGEKQPKIVKVVSVTPASESELISEYSLKWVAQRVDLTSYNAHTIADQEAEKMLLRLRNAKRAQQTRKNMIKALGKKRASSFLQLIGLGE